VYRLHGRALEISEVGWSIGPICLIGPLRHRGQGKKTHRAYPHTGLDPVPVAAEMVQALQLVVSRQIDAQSPKVLTVGSIHGGNRFNIIADQVTLEGTIRTLDPEVRREIKERIQRTVTGVAGTHGLTAALRWVGEGNLATMNDAALTRASVPSLQRVYGLAQTKEVKPQMGAEDFASFAEKVPALYIKMGVKNEAKGITAMIHTEDFDIDERVCPGRESHEHARLGLPGSHAVGAYAFPRPFLRRRPRPSLRRRDGRRSPACPPPRCRREAGLDFVLQNSPSPRKHLIETMPGGVALFDYDGDGRLDIFFTNGAAVPSLEKDDPKYANRLFRNEGGLRFRDVTEAAGIRGAGYSMGVAAADYDNDGRTDLFVAGVRRQMLYRNLGGRFEDVTAAAGVGSGQWAVGGGWFDFDNDGGLDLLVVNYTVWTADGPLLWRFRPGHSRTATGSGSRRCP
jgi:hypothetical protein